MIKYVLGDATAPIGDDSKIITHCCNDIGAWGAGFVLAITRKWPHVEDAYRDLKSYDLGDVQFVKAEEGIVVANIIGQHGIGPESRRRDALRGRPVTGDMIPMARSPYREKPRPPIRYGAIEQGLRVVNYRATNGAHLSSVHMPRMGCGLAGGEWSEIEKIIERTLTVPVTVYDF